MSSPTEHLLAQWRSIRLSNDVNILNLFIQDCERVKAGLSAANRSDEQNLREWEDRIKRSMRHGNRLPQQEYDAICRKQLNTKKSIGERNTEQAAINRIISEARDAKMAAVAVAPVPHVENTSGIIKTLVEMAERYEAFAGDETRVASMKTMAARFATEIRDAIKGAAQQ